MIYCVTRPLSRLNFCDRRNSQYMTMSQYRKCLRVYNYIVYVDKLKSKMKEDAIIISLNLRLDRQNITAKFLRDVGSFGKISSILCRLQDLCTSFVQMHPRFMQTVLMTFRGR
jgi:hypothetical protein